MPEEKPATLEEVVQVANNAIGEIRSIVFTGVAIVGCMLGTVVSARTDHAANFTGGFICVLAIVLIVAGFFAPKGNLTVACVRKKEEQAKTTNGSQ